MSFKLSSDHDGMEYDDVQHDSGGVDHCKIFLFHKMGSKSRHEQESGSSKLA
jgi:hypothetical protein